MKIKWLFFWFILIISFLIFGTALVFGVTGYTYNWQVKKIEKTGLIITQSYPNYAQISLNDMVLERKTPARISYLKQGRYDIEVSKDGYRSWTKTVHVKPEVANIEKAILFLYSPIRTELMEKDVNLADFEVKDKSIKIQDSEIWYQNRLVTRLSTKVDSVAVSPERDYIIYKVGDELRSVMIDGSNDNRLYKLGSPETQFIFKDEDTLLIKELNTFYTLKII